jgi:outer membrane lipoprotein-sorting protein
MKRKFLLATTALLFSMATMAQTADEILAKYFENTGGLEKWKALKGMKMMAKVNQGGMEIPLEIVTMKDGKQMTAISFQGKIIKQGVFDGKDLWSTNFMTQKAEKSDAETTENVKKDLGDFPSPFVDYKSKGYKVELVGKETIEGTETFKLKLTKTPYKIDGLETENVSYFYFDSQDYIPIISESEIKSGPAKGQILQNKFSDYQETSNGLIMSFTRTTGLKGQPGQALNITEIQLDPVIDAKEFTFPEGQ